MCPENIVRAALEGVVECYAGALGRLPGEVISYLGDDAGGHGVDVVGEAPCLEVQEGSNVGLIAESCAAGGNPVGAVLLRNCAARLLCRYLRLFCHGFRESAVCWCGALGGSGGCGRFSVEFFDPFS